MIGLLSIWYQQARIDEKVTYLIKDRIISVLTG